jgi:hypothetical protein
MNNQIIPTDICSKMYWAANKNIFPVTSVYVHTFVGPSRWKAENMFLLSSPYMTHHPLSKIRLAPSTSRKGFPWTLVQDSSITILNVFNFLLNSGKNNTDPMWRIACIFLEHLLRIYWGKKCLKQKLLIKLKWVSRAINYFQKAFVFQVN